MLFQGLNSTMSLHAKKSKLRLEILTIRSTVLFAQDAAYVRSAISKKSWRDWS
jgi:hypothetical protein